MICLEKVLDTLEIGGRQSLKGVVILLAIRGAQTGTFEQDIRIYNPPYIDVCQSLASEAGLKCRNVEKRINAV
jgi:hypothetical protein